MNHPSSDLSAGSEAFGDADALPRLGSVAGRRVAEVESAPPDAGAAPASEESSASAEAEAFEAGPPAEPVVEADGPIRQRVGEVQARRSGGELESRRF